MTRDEAIQKVKKLLALAQGTTNQHEAALAFARAQSIQDDYDIEQAMLAGAGEADEDDVGPINTEQLDGEGRTSKRVSGWRGALAAAIGGANRCKVFYRGTGLYIVGHRGDVQSARYLFALFATEITRHAGKWTKAEKERNPYYRHADTAAYRYGFVEAIRVATRAEKETRKVAASPDVSRALVVLDKRDNAVTQWMKENMRMREGKATRMSGSSSAYAQGRRDGADAYGRQGRGRLGGGNLAIGPGK